MKSMLNMLNMKSVSELKKANYLAFSCQFCVQKEEGQGSQQAEEPHQRLHALYELGQVRLKDLKQAIFN